MGLPPALPSGTMVGGHYIVGSLINSGGFGAVYRAVDTSEGNRLCALKEIYNVTPAARRQALMEASVLFTVRSRHLPEVYDALEANGRFYLVMELIEGQNLLQLLRSRVPGGVVGNQQSQARLGPCSEQEVLDWLLPITEVLQELHSRSHPILHRDIKPGNIIIRPDQTAVLVDFGLTRLYDPQRDTGTLARAVTEGFSPPEQYMGRTVPQSDIYSLAATMYLLLTNCLPPMALQRSVNDLLIPPRQLNPSLSPKVEHALLTALSVQAGLRYQSMREFGAALQAPSFSGYADQTIAAPIQYTGTQPAIPYSQTTGTRPALPQQQPLRLPAPATLSPHPALHAPASPTVSQPGTVYPPPAIPYNGSNPAYGNPATASAPYGGYQAGRVSSPGNYPYHQSGLPPGYVAVPRSNLAPPVQPRPTPSGQGCLWGVVHGLLAGLLVALTADQSNFYLAIIMGFGFYVLTGFITTRKGGGVLRGGRAGFWAGIISTIFFWATYGACYVVLLIQEVQRLTSEHEHIDKIWERAREAVHTALPPNTSLPSGREALVNLAIICGIGVLAAYSLGLIGGFLGNARFKAWWARKMAEPPLQAQPRMRP